MTDIRPRLAKILARLGSEHDGERAAAALLAARMVREAGMTWEQLLTPPTLKMAAMDFAAAWRASGFTGAAPPPPSQEPRGRPTGVNLGAELTAHLRKMIAHPGTTTEERVRLQDIHDRHYQQPHLRFDVGDIRFVQAVSRRLWG